MVFKAGNFELLRNYQSIGKYQRCNLDKRFSNPICDKLKTDKNER